MKQRKTAVMYNVANKNRIYNMYTIKYKNRKVNIRLRSATILVAITTISLVSCERRAMCWIKCNNNFSLIAVVVAS